MEWLHTLFFGSGIAHSVLTIALVITLGILLGKIKIGGVSLGITWILFVGIALSHFGMTVDSDVRHFVQEFGLILFVFSIGLQVGPGFFSSFKHGGLTLVGCATAIVLLGVATAYVIHLVTGTPVPTMVGILSGAVTNTPGLGAAQQAYADALTASGEALTWNQQQELASIPLGYAVAYPLGVVGIILSLIVVRYALKVKFEEEDKALAELSDEKKLVAKVSVEFANELLDGRSVEYMRDLVKRQFVISRILHPTGEITMADGESLVRMGDRLWVICQADDVEAIVAFFRTPRRDDRRGLGQQHAQRRAHLAPHPHHQARNQRQEILRSAPADQIRHYAHARQPCRYGSDSLSGPRTAGRRPRDGGRHGQIGGQSGRPAGQFAQKLDHPNLITIFVGIALGVLLGSIPLMNVPQPVKLGLAGGPLIVAILIGRFGTHFHLVTYTTVSANLMLREVGIALFLAGVGIGAGDEFVDAIVGGGYRWIGYGFIITVLPILIVAVVARLWLKMNYYTLMGLVAGATTDPLRWPTLMPWPATTCLRWATRRSIRW